MKNYKTYIILTIIFLLSIPATSFAGLGFEFYEIKERDTLASIRDRASRISDLVFETDSEEVDDDELTLREDCQQLRDYIDELLADLDSSTALYPVISELLEDMHEDLDKSYFTEYEDFLLEASFTDERLREFGIDYPGFTRNWCSLNRNFDGDYFVDGQDIEPHTYGLGLNGSACYICEDEDGVMGSYYANELPPSCMGAGLANRTRDTDCDGELDSSDPDPRDPDIVATLPEGDMSDIDCAMHPWTCPGWEGETPDGGITTPDSDRDRDRVLNDDDLCPDQRGLPEFQGCPDFDEDGIRDDWDDCPNTPGQGIDDIDAEYPNGCPDEDEFDDTTTGGGSLIPDNMTPPDDNPPTTDNGNATPDEIASSSGGCSVMVGSASNQYIQLFFYIILLVGTYIKSRKY